MIPWAPLVRTSVLTGKVRVRDGLVLPQRHHRAARRHHERAVGAGQEPLGRGGDACAVCDQLVRQVVDLGLGLGSWLGLGLG